MRFQAFNFKDVDPDALKETSYCSVDMHVHTDHSDGKQSVEAVLSAARSMDIGVSITDHGVISGSLEAYYQSDGCMIVPGIEITLSEILDRHILCYFRTPDELENFHIANQKAFRIFSYSGYDLTTLCDIAHEHNGLVSYAHPFGWKPFHKTHNRQKHWKEQMLSLDCVEIINGQCNLFQAKRSYKLARKLKKSYTGGSDSHNAESLGSVVTVFKGRTIDELFSATLKKEVCVIGKKRYVSETTGAALHEAVRHYIAARGWK